MPCCWRRARPSGCGTSRGPTPWSSPWIAPTSGIATTGSWPRCCARSCAGASPRSRPSSTGARANGTPTTATSMRRSAMPRPRETSGSPAICCGPTPSATSLRATTRPSAAGSVTSPTSRWPATRRWRSWPPTPTWPTATAITPSIGPPRPHARSTACRPGAGRRPSRPASRRCARRSPATACSACATMPRAPTHSMRTPAHAIDGSAARGHGVPSARRTRARIRAAGGGITARRGRRAERQRAVPRPARAAGARPRRLGAWPPSSRPARARRSSASGWRRTRR